MLKTLIKFYKKQRMSCEEYARYLGVSIGEGCKIRSKEFGSEPYLIKIGNNVVVAGRVRFYNHGAAHFLRDIDSNFDFFGKIFIGNNVYIGENSIILPGVTIGNNVLIGAGSVVTKSIPDNVTVGGNPAKIIGDINLFKEKMKPFNVGTKKMKPQEKRKFLLSLPDNRFIKK